MGQTLTGKVSTISSNVIIRNPGSLSGLSGEPVIRRTRVPFKCLSDLEHERRLKEFLEDFLA
jgi:uncharacterized protein (DUF433 family)